MSPKRCIQTVKTISVHVVVTLSQIQETLSEKKFFEKKTNPCPFKIHPLGSEEVAVFFAESCVSDSATVEMLEIKQQ